MNKDYKQEIINDSLEYTEEFINKPRNNDISNKTNLINLNFKDTSLEFITKHCYSIHAIINQVIDSMIYDDSELYY